MNPEPSTESTVRTVEDSYSAPNATDESSKGKKGRKLTTEDERNDSILIYLQGVRGVGGGGIKNNASSRKGKPAIPGRALTVSPNQECRTARTWRLFDTDPQLFIPLSILFMCPRYFSYPYNEKFC
jgi:hypothetical protein